MNTPHLHNTNILGPLPLAFFDPVKGEIICRRGSVHGSDLDDALQMLAVGIPLPAMKVVHTLHYFGVN